MRILPWLAAFPALLLAESVALADPLYTLDLRPLYGVASPDIAVRRDAYDTLVAAACVQGIANRHAPSLYLFYAANFGFDTDKLWLDRLSDPVIGGGVLGGRAAMPLATIDAAVDAYKASIAGLVVWDEKVPATVNAAFTAAGADDLVAVRWDASPTSLFARLQAKGLPVKVWLVNANGTSRFLDRQGSALVPDTTRQTSQSAKADAHVWALEKYMKVPGKLDTTELGYMLDAKWIADPRDYNGNANPTSQLQVTNRDWLVARRGLAFDLSPWSDVAATDDPGQPVGTDPAILKELLGAARAGAAGASITIRGFFGWQFKYTTLEGLPAGHEPVRGEWESVKVVSPFGAGLDADAPGLATMANASFFTHVPLSETPEPQLRPTPEDLVGNGLLSGLASNGGFEDGESVWTVHTTNHVVYADDAMSGARAHGGLRFLECNTNAVGNDTQDNLYRDGRGVAPGERVTLRAFVRAPAGAVNGQLVVWGLGGTTEQAVASFTAGATWSEVRVTLTAANAGHTSTRAQIYLKTPTANLDLDDVAFYAGDAAAGAVEPATYALWFVGDYDSAAWIYSFTPMTWDSPGRGIVPFAWDFSGHVASRFPPFFNHALASRTPKDFFVGADSGPGYGNPSEMDGATRAIWTAAGMRAARRLDTSAGWVLNPLDPLDAAHLQATTPFYGDGVLLTTGGGAAAGSIVDHAPLVQLDNLGGTDVPSATSWILGATPATVTGPTFHAFRAVLWKSTDLVAITNALVTQNGARQYRFVDPYSFFELARLRFGGDNKHRASYREVVIPQAVVGKPIHVTLKARNDGWETWRAAGANPYHLGFNVSTTPPAPRALPADPAAYPTRAMLAADVPPGGEAPIAIDLPPVPMAGARTLQVDMVEEGVTWFEAVGDVPLQVTVNVVVPGAVDAGGDGAAGSPDASFVDGGQGSDASGAGDTPGAGGSGGCGCTTAGHDDRGERGPLLLAFLALVASWRLKRGARHGARCSRQRHR